MGEESIAGGKMKKKGTTFWNSPNVGATNESGFNAYRSGNRGGSSYLNYIVSILFFEVQRLFMTTMPSI